MRLTKRQLKRIIREEYSRLHRRRPLRESVEMAADVWSQNGEGTEWGDDLLDALNRSQSAGHLQAMCKYNDELNDTMIDMDSDCASKNISTSAVLGWLRQNYCPKGLNGWYSVDPNDPGAFVRKYGFFDG